MKAIPYGRQNIGAADIAAVVEVLQSAWITQGPAIERFEGALATFCGAKNAIAVCNATSALHLACRALGVQPGDRVWTSPNTFVASANCAIYCGATVDFVDIDPRTYNISVEALETKLEMAARNGTLPKVVIPVHFAGKSCEMRQIKELSDRYGFAIIEDASHAIGGSYLGHKIGSCKYSDIAVFSFHPVKIITTGEGGALTTNRDDLKEKLQLLRSHGITRDPSRMQTESEGAWYYEQIDLGYNFRITDFQAALGASQLARIDSFISRRTALAEQYDRALAGLPVISPWQHPDGASSWHLYAIRIDQKVSGKTRRHVFDHLRSAGVLANVHYIPVHIQPYYQGLGFRPGDFPVAEAYYADAISLPLYFDLSDDEQAYVVDTLKHALS